MIRAPWFTRFDVGVTKKFPIKGSMNFEVRAVSQEKFDEFLALKMAGSSTPEALTAIGEDPFAVTTKPFPGKRTADETS